MYDDEWWVGMVEEIEETDSVRYWINFMHQKGLVPNSGFYWPRKKDADWVNRNNILLVLSSPVLSSSSARMYSITSEEQITIEGIFDNRKNVVPM